jgi:hypothetical protein
MGVNKQALNLVDQGKKYITVISICCVIVTTVKKTITMIVITVKLVHLIVHV